MPTNGDNIYLRNLREQDLTALAELCANVAHNPAAQRTQGDMAHLLRMEWVRLEIDGSLNGGMSEGEKSLQKRMTDFLAGVPDWMWAGL